MSKKDSTDLIVSAHVISGKNNWGGLLFPVFPTFFFPRIDYYKEYPNSLIIELKASSPDSLTLVKDLIIIRVGDRILKPKALGYKGHSYNSQTFTLEPSEPFILKAIRDDPDYIKLEFPIRANDVQEFTLLVHGLYRKGRVVEFPEISFKKTKQRWSFVGP